MTGGRPSKLTPETQKKIIDGIKLGATYDLAASYGGVAYNTFNEWMKAGEAAKTGAFREFYEQVKNAEGQAAVGWLAKIEKAATDGSWQAAAWKLERRHPDGYALTQKHRHGGDPDNKEPIRQEVKTFGDLVDLAREGDAPGGAPDPRPGG